jgi:hypothetical protein
MRKTKIAADFADAARDNAGNLFEWFLSKLGRARQCKPEEFGFLLTLQTGEPGKPLTSVPSEALLARRYPDGEGGSVPAKQHSKRLL